MVDTVTPTPDELRGLLEQVGLGQREAGRILKPRVLKLGHILNEHEFRHYLTGKRECPDVVYQALRDLVNERTNT